MALIDQGLSVGIEDPDLFVLKAGVLFSMKRYEEGLVNAKKAVEISPKEEKSWVLVGTISSALSNYEEAVQAYENILRCSKEQSALFYDNYGYALSQLGRHQEALVQRDKAVALNPDKALYWNRRGVSYEQLGKHTEAVRDYTEAIARDGEEPLYRANLGEVKYKQGDYETAEQQLQHAIEHGIDFSAVFYYLALTQEKLGKPKGVEDLLRKAQELAENEDDEEIKRKIADKLSTISMS